MRLDGDVRMEEDTTSVVLVGCAVARPAYMYMYVTFDLPVRVHVCVMYIQSEN